MKRLWRWLFGPKLEDDGPTKTEHNFGGQVPSRLHIDDDVALASRGSEENSVETTEPTPVAYLPSLEVVSLPGHGKTSYIWALLYTLRRIDFLLPEYACWPENEETSAAIVRLHEAIGAQRLPRSSKGNAEEWYRLLLRRVGPYGARPLTLRDRSDALFSPDLTAETEDEMEMEDHPPVHEAYTGAQTVCWLLSLADLANEETDVLDLRLDRLIDASRRSQPSTLTVPLKLILAFSKADRLADLPAGLRGELKDDPVWQAMAAEAQVQTWAGRRGQTPSWGEVAFKSYLERMWGIHLTLQAWFCRTTSGRLFMERARARQVEVRFAMVSATGGDALGKSNLGMPWAPRRVLDPIFFSFSFDLPWSR